jgi:hypothetical protein
MRRIGAFALADFPLPLVRLDCERCGRVGRYRLTGLIERFGADTALATGCSSWPPANVGKIFLAALRAQFTEWRRRPKGWARCS